MGKETNVVKKLSLWDRLNIHIFFPQVGQYIDQLVSRDLADKMARKYNRHMGSRR